MNELTTFFILAFSTLFTLINPIGLTAVYLSMVEQFDTEERSRIAFKGTITALLILVIFSMIGDIIFSFYGITLSAFKIAGGILFLEPVFSCWKHGYPGAGQPQRKKWKQRQ